MQRDVAESSFKPSGFDGSNRTGVPGHWVLWAGWLAIAAGSLIGQDVRLVVTGESPDWHVRADVTPAAVRIVWERATSPTSPQWTVVGVQTDPVGRNQWTNSIAPSGISGFYRVRAYDTPGFNARMDRVVQFARSEHPEAVLLEAFPLLSSTVSELPDDVGLRVVLRVFGGTLIAEQLEPSGEPQLDFRAAPWLGDSDLPWPVAMNLEEAESALRNAGYGSEYRTLTLRQPVYPGMTEPYFIFGTPNYGFVFVGTITGKVFPGN